MPKKNKQNLVMKQLMRTYDDYPHARRGSIQGPAGERQTERNQEIVYKSQQSGDYKRQPQRRSIFKNKKGS
jgi:hypothetical protein